MAQFLRSLVLIRAAALIPATYAVFSRYPSPAVVRRLMHKDSQFPPAVLRDLRSQLNRIEEDCVRRHREFAAELVKLHNKVREVYSVADAFFQPAGDSIPSFRAAAWRIFASVLYLEIATSVGRVSYYMICVRVKEMRMEVEANLERVIREKVRVAKAQAFEEGRRSVLLNRKSWRQSEGRHC